MRFEWRDEKRKQNLAKHRVDFARVWDFEFDTALIKVDDREDYGELREIAYGFIDQRLHVLVFTRDEGDEELIWIISLRKADSKESKFYAENF